MESCRAPGTVLRVQATRTFGSTASTAFTRARVAVAMPERISISVCAAFQDWCSAAAGPFAERSSAPAFASAPEDTSVEASAPAHLIISAAISSPATAMSPRARNSITPGMPPMPSASVVKSPFGASSASSRSRKERGGKDMMRSSSPSRETHASPMFEASLYSLRQIGAGIDVILRRHGKR